MKYFLKNIGTAKADSSKDLIEEFERFESRFWTSESLIWFSNSNFGGRISKGDIIIQYIPVSHKQMRFAGRIVGFFEVQSDYVAIKKEKWNGYRKVLNKSLLFSLASKEKTLLYIKEVIDKIPKAIQCGCAEIPSGKAENIIEKIKEKELLIKNDV